MHGLNNKRKFTEEALKYISTIAGGDLRYAYNILETSSLSFLKDHLIDIDDIKELNYIPNSHSDLNDDQHYDTVSALQKSIRGSQVDAAIFLPELVLSNLLHMLGCFLHSRMLFLLLVQLILILVIKLNRQL